ncbi:MAG: M20/M25/M40 family metallo-hydrolase [Bryobacteraceae bacterium]
MAVLPPASDLNLSDLGSVSALAESRGVRECLQFFVREKQWINEQHLALCRIPAPTFLEQKRAEWIAQQFRAIGCEAKIDRAGNVVAPLRSERESHLVALTAHLDTVLAPRNPEDIRVEPGGSFHGPGVSDNGAGLSALLAIARGMKSAPLIDGWGGGLVFIANVGEEGEGNLSGMRHLCRQSPLGQKIRSFVILDGPALEHITSEALASRRFEVACTGPGGHSWSDYGVGNPVHALSRAVALFAENRAGAPSSPRSSFNFGVIEGGSSINSIPTVARAKVDLRSERAEAIDDMAALLAAAVERAIDVENSRAAGGRVSAKIREIGSRPGGRLPEDAPILHYIRAVDAHMGIRSHLDCASTDANIPLSLGIPAISIGAGGSGGGAHTPGEWFHPEGREIGLKRIVLMLCLLLRSLNRK